MKIRYKFTPRRIVSALTPATVIAVLWLSGCSTEPESHVVSAPPPPAPTVTTTTAAPVAVTTPSQTITTTTAAVPVAGTIITQAPPAMQQETVQVRPSPQHVWVPGYWTWNRDHYEWVAGRWEVPPRSGAVWVAPRWEHNGNAYTFYEGYWD